MMDSLACILPKLSPAQVEILKDEMGENVVRFPEDFMFTLTLKEKQEVVANCDHLQRMKYSKYLPHVFTEHGAIMVASILNTSRAVGVSIYVVRAFVRLREIFFQHKELAQKLDELERKLTGHDASIKSLFDAIHQLTTPSVLQKKQKIGFHSDSHN